MIPVGKAYDQILYIAIQPNPNNVKSLAIKTKKRVKNPINL